MAKKILFTILSVCLFFVLTNIVVAAEPMIIKLDSKTIKEGKQFNIDISIKNNPGIAGFTMKINFDKSFITPVAFNNKSSFTALTTIDSKDIDLNSVDTINITYDSLDNISTDGIIGTITFKAKENIDSDYVNINWVTDRTSSVYNKNLEDVLFNTENAVLTVEQYNEETTLLYGDADVNNSITANDASLILAKVLDKNKSMPIEKKTTEYMKYVDVDGNGILTAKDASMVLQKALDDNFKLKF